MIRSIFSRSLVLGALFSLTACSASDGGKNEAEEPSCEPNCDDGAVAVCEASVMGAPVLRRLSSRELFLTLRDVFPTVAGKWTSALSSDPVNHLGFDNDSALLVVGKQKAREIDSTATSVADAIEAELATVLPCADAADRACASEFVGTYGKKLFRRPLTAAETEGYLGLFDQALAETDFSEAIGWVTRALIHSTATLYRREIGVADGGTRKLDQYELATALAYTFAGTTPGDALLEMAERGELSSEEVLYDIAKQLIGSAQGKEHLQRFFEGSLHFGQVTALTKTAVPEFSTLRDQMREETRAFIANIITDGGGGLSELLTAPVTYPTAELAAFYGMPAPAADYAEVARPQGVGILAQGSFLSAEAQVNASSPTQRGLLVVEKLLCRDLPTVPAIVPDIPEISEGVTTTRQRYEEIHTAESACGGCHAAFDPIGFGFEHFDEAGRYRADEGGLTIDASGSVPGTDESFGGQEELATVLAGMTEVQACVSGQLKAYAFGSEFPCLGENRRQEFMDGTIGFVEYLASLAAEPHFSTRSD